MSNIKYADKSYLLNYDLSYDFFCEIGINVIDVTPLRKVFILKTDEGKKILKYIDYSTEKLEFVIECINLLSTKCSNVVKLRKFKNNKYYIKWNNKKYVLMDLIDGRETNFSNILELKMCAKNIATLHVESRSLIGSLQNTLNKDIEDIRSTRLKEIFRSSLNNMEFLKYSVGRFKYKNEFDELFLRDAQGYVNDINTAKDLLDSLEFDKYDNDIKNISICHNDLASHNFLIYDNKISIIDFEYVSVDLSIMDLADILLKGIKNAAFDFDKSVEVIEAYDSVNKLSDIDYKILYIIMMYPRDIYSICKNYYFKEKEWDYDVFFDRLNNKVQNEECRKEFLKSFRKKYLYD